MCGLDKLRIFLLVADGLVDLCLIRCVVVYGMYDVGMYDIGFVKVSVVRRYCFCTDVWDMEVHMFFVYIRIYGTWRYVFLLYGIVMFIVW